MPPSASTSTLLIEECYAAEDQRFVKLLRALHEPNALAALTSRWLADPRPWARQQMFRYLSEPFDQPGHAVVVKRLFKHAEKSADDELMGVFLAAFDCLVRRVRRKRSAWDRASRSYHTEEILFTPRNTARPPAMQWNSGTRKMEKMPMPRPSDRLFRYRTRYYLQRRAWRYFRRLGFQKPERYVSAVASALGHYRDADFKKGENYLDSWGFMHACFATHQAVKFTSFRAGFADRGSLADLSPAPAFPALWGHSAGRQAAVSLAVNGGARAVRLWAVKLLASSAMTGAGSVEFADLRRLLFAEDEEIQTAALTLLQRSTEPPRWTVAQWLDLLDAPGASVVDVVTAAMKQHVHPDRLEPAQCLELACARPVPVARMGFEFLQHKSLPGDQIRTLLPLAACARCSAVAGPLTTWCLDKIAASTAGCDSEILSGFFDSLTAEVRMTAWEWLVASAKTTPPLPSAILAWDDPVLWSRLAETPFDDLRLCLVDELARRSFLPAGHTADLAPVWTSVLLAVHRGGRGKRKATEQIAAAIRADHACAETLLPVLAVAVRSIRAPEHRAGLAAVASLMSEETLAAAVQRHLPEVQWT